MSQQSKAKIFLADERGCNESDWFRSYRTFNFGTYSNMYRCPFANLYVLNDETIAENRSIKANIRENSWLLLLPVVGAATCKINHGSEIIISPGELQIFNLTEGDRIELSNSHENGLINFIQVWIKAGITGNNYLDNLFGFDLDKNRNALINVTASIGAETKHPVVSIGKFTGRKEAFYKLRREQNNLFVFVIEGVFEVQGRLLHARDGLALWNGQEDIELEALSNDAIVLLIELK